MKTYKNVILTCILCLFSCSLVSVAENWMPDPKLRQCVKEKLGIPLNVTLHIVDMRGLYDLVAIDKGINDLTGLEHAKNLGFLHASDGGISDLTPLAGLKKLRVLKVYANNISDLTPLAGLVRLEELDLSANRIVDLSPLAGLVNLKILYAVDNLSLKPLPFPTSNLDILVYDQICEIPRTDVTLRVNSRDYPSVFAAWHNIINLPKKSWKERFTYHDIYWSSPNYFDIRWDPTPDGRKLVGDLKHAQAERNAILSKNPSMVFLVGIPYYSAHPEKYPENWDYWLRDAAGNRVREADWGAYLIDFTQPEAQQIAIDEAIAVAECGLFDGIFFDWWSEEWNVLYPHGTHGAPYRSLEAEVKAKVSILRRIREAVGDDFLILVNTNRSKIPRSAPYVNGTFMETLPDGDEGGYTYAGLLEIESTLLWSEENFRDPQINCLEGWATPTEPLDSPINQRWMRVFTTMSLTHSDGMFLLASGIGGSAGHKHHYEIWPGHSDEHARGKPHDHQHEHYWYDFYDADLGRPVGEKGQLYENREGLFIREFTSGWTVYNRSGKEQTIQLPMQATGVENGLRNAIHTVSDLDGEIFLKSGLQTPPTVDVNSDGVVNILDLVAVANGFGKSAPDVNGDGVVNVLDLVAVASAFGQ